MSVSPYLDYAARAAVFVALLLVVLAVARWLQRRVLGVGMRAFPAPATAVLVANLAYAAATALGVLTILPVIGIQANAVIAALGVSGLAISLALQDVLRNFVAGLYLLLERPFGIGDRITLREFTGDVQSIELRTTLLRTASGARVIVPNSALMTEVVTNLEAPRVRAYTLTVSGERGVEVEALPLALRLLAESPDVEPDPAPEAAVASAGVGTVELRARFHTRGDGTAVTRLAAELERALPGAEIGATLEDA